MAHDGNQFNAKGRHNIERERLARGRRIGGCTRAQQLDRIRSDRGLRHGQRRHLIDEMRRSWWSRVLRWAANLIGIKSSGIENIQKAEARRRPKQGAAAVFGPQTRAARHRLFTTRKV